MSKQVTSNEVKKEELLPLEKGHKIKLANGKQVKLNFAGEEEQVHKENEELKQENKKIGMERLESNQNPFEFQKRTEMFLAQTHRAIMGHGVEINAIVNLLIQKGVFTGEEMIKAAEEAEKRQQEIMMQQMQQMQSFPNSDMPEASGPRKPPQGRGPIPK